MSENKLLLGQVSLDHISSSYVIYVHLKKDSYNEIRNKIRKIGIAKLCSILNLNKQIIYKWLLGDNITLRLEYMVSIFNFFKISKRECHINYISGKKGFKLYKPKLPFNFNNDQGARVVAALLGDGCLQNKRQVAFYTNSKKELVTRFIRDVRYIFGDLEYKIRKQNKIMNVTQLPPICYHSFILLGLKKGKKVLTNPIIPPFIFNLPLQSKNYFISQIFDDEGHVNILAKYIKLNFNLSTKFKQSNLVCGINEILRANNIEACTYKSCLSSNNRWQIQISGKSQLEKSFKILHLVNNYKKTRLKKIIDSFNQVQFRKKECTDIYLSKMAELECVNGSFNVEVLSNKLNRTVGHIRNMLHKYHSSGIIIRVKNHKTGRNPLPTEYSIKK